MSILGGNSSGASQINLGDVNDENVGQIGYYHADNSMRFVVNANERARIDSSGTLLVGTTDANLYQASAGSTADNGFVYGVNDFGTFSRYANDPLILNRTGTDGSILQLRKDGTAVGSIGTNSGYVRIGTGDTHLLYHSGIDTIIPYSGSANRDDAISLGYSGARFKNIYATNGTIQTSDRNEKQDIEALTDAETRVAVSAKGLLRKFRWKDAVAEKGDEARTHFGIIAQDLQDAFTAEGLDAGDYAMFISSTWTDEETGEEKTRLGVRYSELLAFIIAAI